MTLLHRVFASHTPLLQSGILALSLSLGSWAWGEEAVLRVQSIRPVSQEKAAVLQQRRAGESKAFQVSENSTGYLKDHYLTDPNTVAALEFLIGGRVGINSSTEIEILNERSVSDGSAVKRVVLSSGSLWVKADAKSLKQPLEIQTNGGVMGIKGTEFTAEVLPDGRTRICCFESNSPIGGVEIHDNSGNMLGVAKPGDEIQFDLRSAPIVHHYDDIQRFREESLQRSFEVMLTNPMFKRFFGEAGQHLAFGVNTAYEAANSVADLQNGPLAPVVDLQGQVQAKGASLQTLLDWSASMKKTSSPTASNFPRGLTPDGPQSPGPYPSFFWTGVTGCQSYVILLGRDSELRELVYTGRSLAPPLAYPSSMRPLEAGTYYWRVIPVDDRDQPIAGLRGAQASFTVQEGRAQK